MPDEASKRSYFVIGALVATLCWLLAWGWLLYRAAPCADENNLLASNLFCHGIGGIGDALAGAFAPVAFLWLVLAVFLQRAELQAQRQELRETRDVSREHVLEARKNVELIGAQTKILEEERSYRIQRESDLQIEGMLKLFRLEAQDRLLSFYVSDGPPDHDNLLQARNVRRFHGVVGDDNFLFVQNIIRGLDDLIDSAHRFAAKGRLQFDSLYDLEGSAGILSMINQTVTTASPVMKANIDRLQMHEAPNKLRKLAKFLSHHQIARSLIKN